LSRGENKDKEKEAIQFSIFFCVERRL